MPYTPPAYNVVNADLKPSGSPAVVVPAYNVVNADLNVEDGGGGGSSQTIIPSGVSSGEFGTPVFMLYHSFITELGGISLKWEGSGDIWSVDAKFVADYWIDEYIDGNFTVTPPLISGY